MHPTCDPASPCGAPASDCGAQPTDPPSWRFAFRLVDGAGARWWITFWLILVLGTIVALGAVAGPWLTGVLGAPSG
jgi:hypothetical protein